MREQMKKQTKQIAAAVIVLAAVLLTGCVDQVSDMSADEIASMMEAKQESIEDFSATMVMTSSFGGEDMTMRATMVTKPPDKNRIEYTEPAELAGMVMVTNGSTMWTYDPAKNQVTKMALPEDMPSEMDYTELVKNLLDENDIAIEGIEDVGSRSAYVIDATPKDGGEIGIITRMRVWVDRENWMLIGIEVYDKDDNLISKVEYRDITFNTGIPDSEFIFETPEGATVVETSLEDMVPKEMTLEEARANLTFDPKTPSYLPEGYEFDHAMLLGDLYGSEQEILSLKYTNGSGILHLRECASDGSDQLKPAMGEPEIVEINGTDGEFTSMFGRNSIQWSADGIDYSLSGAIEKDELVNVAESLV
jgi:outer membrane lipoprotein-sorting protein